MTGRPRQWTISASKITTEIVYNSICIELLGHSIKGFVSSWWPRLLSKIKSAAHKVRILKDNFVIQNFTGWSTWKYISNEAEYGQFQLSFIYVLGMQ